MSISTEVISAQQSVDYLYGKEGPTAKQQLFRDARERFKLFGGGVGGGKSVALCAEGIRLSLMWAGNRGFMARHESEAFRKTTLATLLKVITELEELTQTRILIPNGHNQTKKELTFINKSVILYGGLGGPEDKDRIKSLEIGWFCVDEASETVFEVINMLKARLRWKLTDGTYPDFFGLFASNPEPGWLKNTFVLPQQRGEPLPNHIFIQALIKDNPWLPPDYLDGLRESHPASWIKRYVEGSWDAVEGQVWPEFDYNTHVFPNEACGIEIPPPWDLKYEVFGSLDHGQTHPTCFLAYYTDKDGNIFVFDEYYKPGLASKHCKSVQARYADHLDKFDYISADPSMFANTREKYNDVWSLADEYAEHGIDLDRANNNVLAGVNRVGEYLRVDPNHPHPFLDQKGSPRLFISASCRNLITEIPEYIWKRTDETKTQKEEPRKVNDHACDSLRYGIMTRPSPYVEPTPEMVPYTIAWYVKQNQVKLRSNKGYIEEGV